MHEIFNLYLHQHRTTLGPNVFMASQSTEGDDEVRCVSVTAAKFVSRSTTSY